jgi:hypothetical protein
MNYFMQNRNRPDVPVTYTSSDLQGGWEFKILTSEAGAFRKTDELRQASEEEAPAGWVLVEKLDDYRLRFKRPIQARSNDIRLAIDPYRSNYGMGMSPTINRLVRPLIFFAILIGGGIGLYLWFRMPR